MYKIKIINYKPYEYELLQQKLDELGKDGYECKDISFLSIFKKTDHPVYYKIDFFKQIGTSRVEQMALKEQFFYPYLDKDYSLVYKHRGMYAFMGTKDVPIHSKKPKETITKKINFNYLTYFLLTLMFVGFFTYKIITQMNVDSLLSYGMTFVYIGGFLLGLTELYRTFMNFMMMNKFHEFYLQKKSLLEEINLKNYRFIYKILFCVSLTLLVGGLIEDVFNAKDFSLEEHPILRLNDLSIENQSELTYKKQSSFTVPHSYTTLETTQENEVLYTKEYQFASLKLANSFYQDIIKDPKEQSLTSVKEHNRVLYGYVDKDLTTLIIQKEKNVILVSVTFPLSQDQIDTILNHY